jgi:hypothetical protein
LLIAAIVMAVFAGSAWATAQSDGKAITRHRPQDIAFTIVSLGRGKAGDEVRPGGNFAIAPGLPVRVTVTNFTHQVHTFSVPGLHLSVAILPARGQTPRKTTFTFTAHEWGRFAWHCVVCVGDHHRHVMAGTVYVIINPSVLA